ncbi:hypothetical protein B0H13DRAFT_2239969 [Mycena leptocephala]|nr:hypothetical protein B0H13DRAFT_2239969 [Mycena leptocephala]
MSSYESLRAAGTSVVLGRLIAAAAPCICFRDLVMHTIVVATGGVAVIAAPVLEPFAGDVLNTFGDIIAVEVQQTTDFATTSSPTSCSKKLSQSTQNVWRRLRSSSAFKVLLITLKYQITVTDAALGFYRSSIHKDPSMFAKVKDYLAIEKGWFSPYLFASARRPIIPRTMKPDIVFCHGPFLGGEQHISRIGETLLAESAKVIALCGEAPVPETTNLLHSRPPSPSEPVHTLAALPTPPAPRRMVILCVGLKPHRKLWSTSARPGESVLNYILLNGCPQSCPCQVGAPLIAWDTLTLEQLWKNTATKFGGIAHVLFEYLDMCVDWERVVVSGDPEKPSDMDGRKALQSALGMLVAAAIRSGNSKEVKKRWKRKEVELQYGGYPKLSDSRNTRRFFNLLLPPLP